MLVTRTVTAANRCGFCHLALLNTFASLAGIPLDLQSLIPASRQGKTPTRRVGQPGVLLSTSPLRKFNTLPVSQLGGVVEDRDQRLAEAVDNNDSRAPSAAPIPWYLQIDTPQAPLYPISDRQRLPDMPVDPPPVLEPLLKYVSIDLGLDDLSLFDLRKLDPPPALGSNLLMILGTARSERHLHVSADRLCRWLRSTYRLTPFADGLLGRNELKLKMRRKARRAKLLGSVGTSASNNADDGVRTGWVCVNVGTVESGKASQADTAAPMEIVGFASRITGVKIVIQMLTEEKRGELDLEELWGGVLKEQVQSPATALDHAEEKSDGIELCLAPPIRTRMTSDRSRLTTSSYLRSNLSNQMQIRGLHFERKLSGHGGSDETLDQTSRPKSTGIVRMSQPVTDKNSSRTAALFSSGTVDQDLDGNKTGAFHTRLNVFTLQDHLKYLRSLPLDAAWKALGQNVDDSSSTSFLKSLHVRLSETGNLNRWKHRLDLLYYANAIGHEGYPKSSLMQIFRQAQGTRAKLPWGIFLKMLRLTLYSIRPGITTDAISPADLTTSVEILAELKRRGCKTLPEDVFIMLQKATGNVKPLPDSAVGKSVEVDAIGDPRDPRTAQERLSDLLATFTVRTVSEHDEVRDLESYAKQNHWYEFWTLWRAIARQGRPRSGAMYTEMFRAIAKSKRRELCEKNLRTWVPAMDEEKPPVKLEGEVAKAVKDCLLVAHPEVEEDAHKGSDATGEWAPLWERCQLALHEAPGPGLDA